MLFHLDPRIKRGLLVIMDRRLWRGFHNESCKCIGPTCMLLWSHIARHQVTIQKDSISITTIPPTRAYTGFLSLLQSGFVHQSSGTTAPQARCRLSVRLACFTSQVLLSSLRLSSGTSSAWLAWVHWWTWYCTGGRLVFTSRLVMQGPRRCVFAHLSREGTTAAMLLWCTGFWHQGWNTGSHLQALSYLLLVVHGPRRCYSVHSRDGEVRHGLNQR